MRLVGRASKINLGEKAVICFADTLDVVSAIEAMHVLQVRRC